MTDFDYYPDFPTTRYEGPFEFHGNLMVIDGNIALLVFDHQSYKSLKSLSKQEKLCSIGYNASTKDLVICNLFSKELTERKKSVYFKRVKKLYESQNVKIN